VYTNDPQTPSVMVTLAGDVKPVPEFVKRMGKVDLQRGELVGGFLVWPSARPAISIDRGERFSFGLRIRPSQSDAGELQLSTRTIDKIGRKLRRETNGSGYWLDIDAGPFGEGGTYLAPIELAAGANATAVTIHLTVIVLTENLVATPSSLDLGELRVSSLQERPRLVGRLGIRKQAGQFHVTAFSSSLGFIKLEQQTIIDGSNYLIRLTIDPALLPKPGSYTGVVRIETDDGSKPRVEVPVKVTVVDR
jgi:hypothetical protein